MTIPIIHCHGSQADAAFDRHAAFQMAMARCPALAADPDFSRLASEAKDKFLDAFEVMK